MQPERNATGHPLTATTPADAGAPLTARSLIASLLLGTDPPRLAGRRLVRAAERFGFSENATRVALSRMVGAGELAASDGDYGLAGPLLDRRRRQEAGRRPTLRRWDGSWLVAVAGATGARRSAGQRSSARRLLLEARLAEWREGVWVRPDNLAGPRPAIPGCAWLAGARPEDPLPVAELWSLGAWAGRARALLGAMAGTLPSADHPEPSFRLAAAVVRHLRDDPLLPAVLLPADWPGDELRSAYDGYEAAFQAALRPVLHAR
jgi:phenylacetic acid degradation operon negative regulatory protein